MKTSFPLLRYWQRLVSSGLGWRNPACVRQHNEEDCGAACIATICLSQGQHLPLSLVRQRVGTSSHGTTLLGLKRGAEDLGFHARPVKAGPFLLDQLDQIPLPAICHWRGTHWVVLHGRRGRHLVVADPALGIRQMDSTSFLSGWNDGVLLLLEPDPLRFPVQLGSSIHGQPPTSSAGLLSLGRYIIPFRSLLIQAFFLNLAIGFLALALPLLMQVITDDVLIRGDQEMLQSLAIGILVLFGLRALLNLLQGTLVGHFGQKLQLQMILHYGRHLLRLPLEFFEGRRSGEVVSRLGDIKQINQLISQLVLGLPGQFCIALVSLAWMWRYSQALSLAALFGYVFVIAAQLMVLPSLQRRTQGLLVQSADNQGFLVEIFRSATLLKTTEAATQAWEEFQRDFGRLAHLSWNLTLLDLRISTLTNLLGSVITIVLLWYGSSLVLERQLSIGQLLAFNGMGSNVLAFLAAVGGLSQEAITSKVVMNRLNDALEHPAEDAGSGASKDAVISASDDIDCRSISFHHPGRLALIDGLNLRIPGGVTTALIGESGCGKSTLSKLIAGLYSLHSGSIHYGPFSCRDLSLQCLRRQVVLLPQEDVFLNRSIIDNFTFTYPWLRFDEIVRLCQLTLADDFIRDLPSGYGTILGEFGTNLSGGQRQRLALARALASDPPILILDESTSALDPILETQLMDRLLTHRRGKTTLLVSHRPSVILRADWIIFMEKGRIIQQNHPKQLRDHIQVAPFLQAVS
jgi:ABC-type bacteriocin/lantibiotic exporter with double-glycine peptidase domain